MKTLKQLFATIILAMALGASVHAGDMGFPPVPPPPPPGNITTGVTSPAADDQGNQSPAMPDAATDASIIAYDLLCDLLSIY
jgi:hypothetical protein